jgi:hypothetical protein
MRCLQKLRHWGLVTATTCHDVIRKLAQQTIPHENDTKVHPLRPFLENLPHVLPPFCGVITSDAQYGVGSAWFFDQPMVD